MKSFKDHSLWILNNKNGKIDQKMKNKGEIFMKRFFLHAKIHRARITKKSLDYEGSITIDEVLMKAVGIEEGELVQVVNIENGSRFETYVIKGPENSGAIELNGAAARMGELGDKVIIMAYALFDEDEERRIKTVVLDSQNRINRVL